MYDHSPEIFSGGFVDTSRDSARAFRVILDALARPCRIGSLSGGQAPGLSAAASTLLLSLCDHATPIYIAGGLSAAPLLNWLDFHCGCPRASSSRAAHFVLAEPDMLDCLSQFAQGEAAYPDRSATLIVELPGWPEDNVVVSGPGIAQPFSCGLPKPAALMANQHCYPLGVDLFFCVGSEFMGLPRSTRVEMMESLACM